MIELDDTPCMPKNSAMTHPRTRSRMQRHVQAPPPASLLITLVPVLLALAALAFARFNLRDLFQGLWRIIVLPDILINDYIGRSGAGPALFNAALCSGAAVCALQLARISPSGPAIAAVFTIAGFSFFGKNIVNIWPVGLGVLLYSRLSRRPFSDNILVALFGTALAPLFSEIAFGLGIAAPWNLASAFAASVAAGMILPPLAKHVLDFHRGYNLYNIGFTAGFVGTVTMSLLKAFGVELSDSWVWSNSGPFPALLVLIPFFVALVVWGMILDPLWRRGYAQLLRSSGRLVSDFVRQFGLGTTLVNMGIMGILASVYALAIGASWNGPIIGAILTIVGFSAFGKHPLNALPPMVGVTIMASLSTYGLDHPGSQLAALFAATLAPVSGTFGPVAGLAAGALHLVLVQVVGSLHGGMNLYNNGFAGGLAAGLLVPILEWIGEWKHHEV